MNTNLTTCTALSESLSLLTYNGNQIRIPIGEKLNLFMGIGLWSKQDGLSAGLPIDILQMLLSAATLRLKIVEANPMKSSKIIVLIADSMAIKEGADKMKVKQMTSIYQQCLEPLLTLLNIKECTQIILSSQLEEDSHYQETLKEVSKTKALQEHTEDREHYDYICTQSVITHAMSLYQDVGIKVGWINKVSAKELKHPRLDRLIGWDELKFDTICKASGCAMQYLYAKAGLKMIVTSSKNIGIKEGCPYTAYADHHRYVMKHEASKSVVIAKPLSAIARHWIPVVQACLKLKTIDALNTAILPKAMHATNNIVAVQQCLSYWTNLPVPSKNEEKESQGTK